MTLRICTALIKVKRRSCCGANDTSDQNPKKRAGLPDEDEDVAKKHSKSSRYDRFTDKMTEVEAIEREKHVDGPYTEQQLQSWAHLIYTDEKAHFLRHTTKQRILEDTQQSKAGSSSGGTSG